jgi:hypothetical protein
MKKKSKIGLRRFQLKVLRYGNSNSYYIDRIADLEKALAKRPRRFQIDLIGDGEISADWALLIRSVMIQRAPQTRLITNARSSLQGGTALIWLLGDHRAIRSDARMFFRRVVLPDDSEVEEEYAWKGGEPEYTDSFSETDPEDADYIKVLQLINEFLPVKELAGKVINLSVLRQFGLVENEKLDRFLTTIFGKPQEQTGNSTSEPRQKRTCIKTKVSKSK